MQIESVHIRNFRCIADATIEFSNYTAFIGANGSGKSSVLYAIAWFFGNRPTVGDDLRRGPTGTFYSVEITFNALNERDRDKLGDFVNGDTVTFIRYSEHAGKTDVWRGSKKAWPAGNDVLMASPVAAQIEAYETLRTDYPDLPEGRPKTGKQVKEILEAYQTDRPEVLDTVEVDAKDVFAANGPMKQLIDPIFIAGSADLTSEMDGGGKSTVLYEMTSRLVESTRRQSVEDWKGRHKDVLDELESNTRSAVQERLGWHQNVISKSLARYIPGAEVEFDTGELRSTLDISLQIAPTVKWYGGEAERIGQQGHGTQRAMMMAMVESLAVARREDQDEDGPVLLLLVEEPEIFQHPSRARHFARQLFEMSNDSGFQVVVATHSQHFVGVDYFESLRLVRSSQYGSVFTRARVDSLATQVGETPQKIRKALLTEIPRGVAEGFFADAVLVVEGITDRVILESIAELENYPMDHYGIAVIDCGTKVRVPFMTRLFEQFGIPTYFVFDGDFTTLEDADTDKKRQARLDHQSQTRQCVKLLEIVHPLDEAPYVFGDETLVTSRFAVFRGKLEDESDSWESFNREMTVCNPSGEKKNPYHYRTAARKAEIGDSPDALRAIVRHVKNLADQTLIQS